MTTNLLPQRHWLLAYLFVLLMAGTVYFPTYRFSLPYIDHPDEPAFNLAAQMWIDEGSAKEMSFHAYPPGIIAINFLALKFIPHEQPKDILPAVRFVTVLFALGTIGMLMLMGRELAGEWAGLFAGVLWMSLSDNVYRAAPAIPNNPLTFFSLLALYLVWIGRRRGNAWHIAGHYALMLAIVFKTQAIFLFPILLAVRLWSAYETGDRHSVYAWTYQMLWRWGLFMLWLLVFYPTLEADSIPYFVADSSRLEIPSWQTLSQNFNVATARLTSLDWGLIALPLASVFIPSVSWRVASLPLISLYSAVAAWWIGISMFGVQDGRQFITMNAMLTILRATGLNLLIAMLVSQLLPLLAPRRLSSVTTVSMLLGIGLFSFIPLQQAFAISQELNRTDYRADIARYADSSLESGAYIGNWNYHKVFNSDWGGYQGTSIFPLFEQTELETRSISEWQALGVRYALIPYISRADYEQTAWANESILLKQFPEQSTRRGPTTSILYLSTPLKPEQVISLAGIRLVAYQLNQEADELSLRLFWQAQAPTASEQNVFVHLLNSADEIVSQADASPIHENRRPTSTWDDPDEILMSQVFRLLVPEVQSAYRLKIGLYDPQTGIRLQSDTGLDGWEIVLGEE